MKPKPRIFKADDGWSVELPAFGFGSSTTKPGFASREAAGTWLTQQGNIGSGSQHIERASATRPWKRESRRARRKREQRGVTPLFPSKPVDALPTEVATPAVVPTFNTRDITDRLKAAERCVLDVAEALTGERHDGVFDYDDVRRALLAHIEAGRPEVLPRASFGSSVITVPPSAERSAAGRSAGEPRHAVPACRSPSESAWFGAPAPRRRTA